MNKTLSFKVDRFLKHVGYNAKEPNFITMLHYQYMKHCQDLKLKTDTSLYTEVSMINYFFEFLKYKNITDLTTFTYLNLQELITYLKTCTTSKNKPLSKSSQRLVYTFFKSFAKWLSYNNPNEAPPLNIFLKSPYKHNNDDLKTVYINDENLGKIKKALKSEDDIYTKVYILLLMYYGLRSYDIMSLRHDCLLMSDKDGKFDFHYIDHKLKENVVIPAISSYVAKSISSLIFLTSDLRAESGLLNIFLKRDRYGEIIVFGAYQKSMLDSFIKRHNIVDDLGNFIKITSHMFRRTLATNMQSEGVSIDATQSILNHKHKRTTFKHYIKTKNKDYVEQISQTLENMILISSSMNYNGYINTNASIRLSDGYCINSRMLNDDTYMCDTLKKRGNCYGCSKMVTTPEFIPYFKKLVEDKQEELKLSHIYGTHISRQIEFEVEMANAILNKLMDLK